MSHDTTTTNNANQGGYFQYDGLDSDNSKRKKDLPCTHCQNAQLTCDGSRPCQSCYKRGLMATCTDATRKKQKYLTDQSFSTPTPSFMDPLSNQPSQTMDPFIDHAQLLNFSLADLGFGSETAGLEYGIIGNMLQHPMTELTPDTMNNNANPSPSTSLQTPFSTSSYAYSEPLPNGSDPTGQAMVSSAAVAAAAAQFSSLLPISSGTMSHTLQATNDRVKTTTTPQIYNTPGTSQDNSPSSTGTTRRKPTSSKTPEMVYNSVRSPFNYAEGFHYLIRYVKEKMGREDLMRISRALSLFRPSFLALIMNLTEEDLVFMEKCIQRTLLEYEKLISFSGTPTVVWRRTGEICLVGKEFSLLTQWGRETLLGKRTYIYELMDNQSAVEYWEKFSTHAFDNTDKACIYSCILRTPSLKPVPCTFCFTIKRDIFDLPSVIVGNFLPILS